MDADVNPKKKIDDWDFIEVNNSFVMTYEPLHDEF